jgi:LmbE family N-acetylglucosaminyl deacetylase
VIRPHVVAVVAHPDDAEIWCGGTLLNHRAAGYEVSVVYVRPTTRVRKREAIAAARSMGARVEFLPARSPVVALEIVLAKAMPAVIITHWSRDSHAEHVAASEHLARALPNVLIRSNLWADVFYCDTYSSIGRDAQAVFAPSELVDVTGVWSAKLALIDHYGSQPVAYWKELVEAQCRLLGSRIGVRYAEGFVRMTYLGRWGRAKRLLGSAG